MSGGAGQGGLAAETARCARYSAAVPGGRTLRCGRTPSRFLLERGDKPRGPGASWADWSSHPVDRQQLLDPKSNGVWNLPLADRSGCPVEEQGIQHKDRATLQFAAPPRGIKVGPRPWRAGQDPPSREYSERGVSAGCLELRPPPAPPDRRERRTGLAVAQGEVRPAALKGHT
ncbi:hypothetical protein NDU88_003925 [Pleurodeles waltl]|uniref:HNH endonuclease n=1 Tax=Pleurodeles waltl TaxID=8319 RepID=A0AAV7W6Z0_PLEWA|nr:hypothetical protein NDU88_003925 [Pleurodeles waltl]